jgi:hypothetical protein
MAKKRSYTVKKKKAAVRERKEEYGNKTLRFYSSFEEQAQDELKEMAKLTPLQVLKHLRKFINLTYGMHGYDPKKLPKKHTLHITGYI